MFYTYLWLRENGTPYYVGKGSGNRAYTSNGHGVHRPVSIERIVLYPAASEDEAFENEVALIWYYGRKDLGLGCLRNLTGGGEKPPIGSHKNHKHSDVTKKVLSVQGKALWDDPEYANSMSKSHVGQVAWNKGKKCSKEHIENLKTAQRAAHKSPNRKLKGWKHGTKTGYGNHQCRCEACVKYAKDYWQKRKQKMKCL